MNDSIIQDIIRSISKANNGLVLENISLSLARATDANCVFIADLDLDKAVAKTFALCINGSVSDNITYEIKHSPCRNVFSGDICVITENVQSHYPHDALLVDMGIQAYVGMPLLDGDGKVTAILVALFEKPISSSKNTEALFLLFSELIRNEFEKNTYMNKLSVFNKFFEQTKSGVMICNSDVEIVYTNQAFTDITGYTAQEVLGTNPRILSSGKQDVLFYQNMWDKLLSEGQWQGEIIDRRKNGELFPDWLTISTLTNDKGDVTHYVSNFYDISDRKSAQRKIDFQANYDFLTHLPNKHLFNKTLQANINDLSANSKLAVFLIDIDLFKDINDFYGHRFGDELLKDVTKRLSSIIKPVDTLAHFGSDDFAIIAADISSQAHAEIYIEHVMESFAVPFLINDIDIKTSISCGAVCYPNKWPDIDIFEMAEKAMYEAKAKGRNRICFFSDELHKASRRRIELSNKLTNAISHNALDVFYQPIYCTKKKCFNKCEALVRWKDAEQWITPFEFIPIAEEFGLISDIGKFVLNKACEFLRELKTLGFDDMVISVNRSIFEFPVNEIDNNQWIDIIRSYGLKPSDICFELTESVLAPEHSNNLTMLKNLQENGSTVALDDFGTGYSPLSYLRRFPIDFLKIDRSFVKEMTDNVEDKIIVSTIIAMAKTLNIKIIAEGAETLAQVNELTNLACDYIQGYHFSKPLPATEFIHFMKNAEHKL